MRSSEIMSVGISSMSMRVGQRGVLQINEAETERVNERAVLWIHDDVAEEAKLEEI